MDAARVAAERGHRVTLIERSEHLGGRFRLAAKQPKRHEIGEFLTWLEGQLTKHQVGIRRATALSVDQVKEMGADEIILATGSRTGTDGFQRALPHVGQLPGADLPHVRSAEDALDDLGDLGGRILIIDDDGGWRGVGTALYLTDKGHAVTILTAGLHPGQDIAHTASVGLMMKDLTAAGIAMLTSSAVLAIEERVVRVKNLLTGVESEAEADSVVLATLPRAETGLAAELDRAGLAVTAIGDCVAPRKASMALFEARRAALAI
ncbi:MAG: FAD-dependent oxidoreductase [Geminicoccaceae bacterium]